MTKTNQLYRASLPVRFCHATLVLCFLLTAFSGISLFFPSLDVFGRVLGSPQLVRLLHPFFGGAVFLLLCFMLLNLAKHNIFDRDDVRWLKNIKLVILAKENERIPIGKYNAGQKLLFWCIMILICVLLCTGLVIWRRYFAGFFSIEILRIAVLLHSMAGIALMLLILGHAYMAIWVKGSIRGMIVGYVTRAWAKKNHSAWYKHEMTQIFTAENTKKSHKK